MAAAPVRIERFDAPAREVLEPIERGLDATNAAKMGAPFEVHRFALHARGDDGRLLGGLIGLFSLGWLYVDELWVDGPERRRGVGGALLEAAEAHARALGFRRSWLRTASFQGALGFYKKRGYEVFAEREILVETMPDPLHLDYSLRKML